MNLNEIFSSFTKSRKTIKRINPVNDLPIIALMHRTGQFSRCGQEVLDWTKYFEGRPSQTAHFRYLLIKLSENKSLGGSEEEASYLLRITARGELSHFGIAGAASRELVNNVPNCFVAFHQSHHIEPAIIAGVNDDDGNPRPYAVIEGGGFLEVDTVKKTVVAYGRSKTFPVPYDAQRDYYLGMTSHEFAVKIMENSLSGWSYSVVHNDMEASGDIPNLKE
jgi:hypothetical protein